MLHRVPRGRRLSSPWCGQERVRKRHARCAGKVRGAEHAGAAQVIRPSNSDQVVSYERGIDKDVPIAAGEVRFAIASLEAEGSPARRVRAAAEPAQSVQRRGAPPDPRKAPVVVLVGQRHEQQGSGPRPAASARNGRGRAIGALRSDRVHPLADGWKANRPIGAGCCALRGGLGRPETLPADPNIRQPVKTGALSERDDRDGPGHRTPRRERALGRARRRPGATHHERGEQRPGRNRSPCYQFWFPAVPSTPSAPSPAVASPPMPPRPLEPAVPCESEFPAESQVGSGVAPNTSAA